MKKFVQTASILAAVMFAVPAFAQVRHVYPLSEEEQKETAGTVERAIVQAARAARKAQQLLQQKADAPQDKPTLSAPRLQAAQKIWKFDKKINNGKPLHTVQYYYNLLEKEIPSCSADSTIQAVPCTTEDGAVEYCIFCGEAITELNQKCPTQEVLMCRTTCPECGKDLRNPKNLSPDGKHHCRFKLHLKPVAPKTPEQANTQN